MTLLECYQLACAVSAALLGFAGVALFCLGIFFTVLLADAPAGLRAIVIGAACMAMGSAFLGDRFNIAGFLLALEIGAFLLFRAEGRRWPW